MANAINTQAHNHVLPVGLYLLIGGSLIVLTALTVYVSLFNFGEWNLIVAMAIAATKASLVVLYFMHLKYDKKIFSVVFVGALLFLAVFIVLTMMDTMTRGDIDPVEDMPVNPNAVIYEQAPAAVGDSGIISDSAAVMSPESHSSEH